MKHIRKSIKNIHSHLLVTDTDTDTKKMRTDTDTKKFENGYGYGYKKIWERIRIRIQNNLRADTDTDTVLIIFTDIVSVDGYLYPSDPAKNTSKSCKVTPKSEIACLYGKTEFLKHNEFLVLMNLCITVPNWRISCLHGANWHVKSLCAWLRESEKIKSVSLPKNWNYFGGWELLKFQMFNFQ